MSNTLFCGIDPGLSGAIAVLNDLGEIISLQDTPTIRVKRGPKNKNTYLPASMATILSAIAGSGRVVMVGVERQQAMPAQGATSGFTTGYGMGLWIGIISALRLPLEVVESKAWKKYAAIPSGSDKAASIVRAQQLWPKCRELARKKDDGRADSLMIARYVRATSAPITETPKSRK